MVEFSNNNQSPIDTTVSGGDAMSSVTTVEDLRGVVVLAMKPHLERGVAYAQQQAARELPRLSERRVRAYWERTIKTVTFQEADALRAWHRQWKRREIARLTQQLEQLQMQLGSEP